MSAAEVSAADELLSGPRGRRLCLRVATSVNGQVWTAMRYAAKQPADDNLLSALVRVLRDIDPTSIATTDEKALLLPLAESVDAARYWQEPDEEDRLLTNPTIVEALRTIAQALASAPSATWWSSPVALTQQRHVTWLDEGYDVSLSLVDAAGKLERWKATTQLNERKARLRALSVPISGDWTSSPTWLLPTTTREAYPATAQWG
ncbi:hypothetical protein [Glaciihabitans sp. UYNi722]|uniref:hypothetical protein n=1 Tax=Glaciihabitans sp. UYNi722 TaxID=3156344 RepID=UPI00339793EB